MGVHRYRRYAVGSDNSENEKRLFAFVSLLQRQKTSVPETISIVRLLSIFFQ
jgi:hypothetical protein